MTISIPNSVSNKDNFPNVLFCCPLKLYSSTYSSNRSDTILLSYKSYNLASNYDCSSHPCRDRITLCSIKNLSLIKTPKEIFIICENLDIGFPTNSSQVTTGQKLSSHLFCSTCPQIVDFCYLVYLKQFNI